MGQFIIILITISGEIIVLKCQWKLEVIVFNIHIHNLWIYETSFPHKHTDFYVRGLDFLKFHFCYPGSVLIIEVNIRWEYYEEENSNSGFTCSDRCLYFKGRLHVPKDFTLKRLILFEAHVIQDMQRHLM